MAQLHYTRTSLILLFCLTKFILTGKHYDILGQRLECVTSPQDLCINMNCTTRPINRNLKYFYFECFLPEPVDNIMVRVTMYYKFAEYRKFLIDVEANICDILDNKITHPLAKVTIPMMLNVTNIRSCPFVGAITANDVSINSDYNPPGLPAGQYRWDSSARSHGRVLFKTKIYFIVKPKGLAQLEMG